MSDHRLVRTKMNIQLALKKKTARDKPLRRLIPKKEAPQRSLQESLSKIEQEHDGLEEGWRSFQEAVFSAADTVGFVKRKHQDWYDENEEDIKKLIDKLHKAHKDHLDDKTSSKKKQDYQQKLRKMKNDWWEMKAEKLRAAADNHDMKTFHDGLRTVYGPRASASIPVRSFDQSTLLTEKTDILARWAEHFSSVLNRESTISDEAIASLPLLPVKESLADPPTSAELAKALKQTSPGKAPGADGIPANIYKWRSHAPGAANAPVQIHLGSRAGSTRPQRYHSFASLGRFLPGSSSTDSPHTPLIPSSLNRSADLVQVGAPVVWLLLSLSYRRNAVSRIRSSTWCS